MIIEIGERLSQIRKKYWVTSIEMFNPITEDNDYVAEISFDNEEEMQRVYQELLCMVEQKVPFDAWANDIQMLVLTNSYNTPPVSDSTLTRFQFEYSDENGVHYQVTHKK